MARDSQTSHEPLSGERLQQIKAHHQLVAMEGEDRHHSGEPWPDVVGRQHTAIFDLLREVERLTKEQKRGSTCSLTKTRHVRAGTPGTNTT